MAAHWGQLSFGEPSLLLESPLATLAGDIPPLDSMPVLTCQTTHDATQHHSLTPMRLSRAASQLFNANISPK
ncbi:hypothetical protein PtrM4_115190 [Pyrenophora tritici-repentis]|uniref:Uncharacterized protein n=1 Tax=Pyrenophora tritici-repentis TaxID=45151 RepID=A0A834RSL8_9PLEO|nr:hypothetical protein PtrM4_115190 [Pyrenophora tritici-repentis]